MNTMVRHSKYLLAVIACTAVLSLNGCTRLPPLNVNWGSLTSNEYKVSSEKEVISIGKKLPRVIARICVDRIPTKGTDRCSTKSKGQGIVSFTATRGNSFEWEVCVDDSCRCYLIDVVNNVPQIVASQNEPCPMKN